VLLVEAWFCFGFEVRFILKLLHVWNDRYHILDSLILCSYNSIPFNKASLFGPWLAHTRTIRFLKKYVNIQNLFTVRHEALQKLESTCLGGWKSFCMWKALFYSVNTKLNDMLCECERKCLLISMQDILSSKSETIIDTAYYEMPLKCCDLFPNKWLQKSWFPLNKYFLILIHILQ